ncbi:MAG: redoxin domain-containing protein [Planctomycetota bacterium]
METYRSIMAVFAAGLLLALTPCATQAAQAPDFPPGVFTDGKQYSLEQLRGEVVVLFFYEQNCPSCTRKIPDRNKVVQQFRGEPVTFIAIAAGDSSSEASAYVKRTKLDMPVFADKLSMMEKLYNTKISLNNIYQFRVIGPDGKIVGYTMDAPTINKALAQVKPASSEQAYNPQDYHDALKPVVELLNADKYKDALRGLSRPLRDRDEALKTSAEALQSAALAQAQGWVEQADQLVETDPFEARRLYTKASELFPREPFAKDVRKKLAQLKSNQVIKDEASARKMYVKMIKAIDKMKPEQAPELVAYARKIAEKYPDTPTGKRCAAMADKLGS